MQNIELLRIFKIVNYEDNYVYLWYNRKQYRIELTGLSLGRFKIKMRNEFGLSHIDEVTNEFVAGVLIDYTVSIACQITEKYNKLESLVLLNTTFDLKKEKIKFTTSALKDVVIEELHKYSLTYQNPDATISKYWAEYGRINMIAGVSGGGKTHTTIFNCQRLLANGMFDKVIYIAKELGNSKLKQRFKKAIKKEDVHPNFEVVDLPLTINDNNIMPLLEATYAENIGKKLLFVLDNGTNFAISKEDTARTGLGMLGMDIHEWLVVHNTCSLLWLTQIQRESIRELFTHDKKKGSLTFNMTLGDTKTSSTLYELADTVIGLASYTTEDKLTLYYNKRLKNGDL